MSEPALEPEILSYATVDQEAQRRKRSKRICVGVIFAAGLVFGMIDGVVRVENTFFTLLFSGVIALSTLAWMVLDAVEGGRRPSLALRLLTLLVSPAGFLLYCLARRRFRTL